jgi:hypothetical protein
MGLSLFHDLGYVFGWLIQYITTLIFKKNIIQYITISVLKYMSSNMLQFLYFLLNYFFSFRKYGINAWNFFMIKNLQHNVR